jgi:hypothetical protein
MDSVIGLCWQGDVGLDSVDVGAHHSPTGDAAASVEVAGAGFEFVIVAAEHVLSEAQYEGPLMPLMSKLT